MIANGAVVAVVATNAGDNYTSAPSVTLSGGGGSGAAATADLAGASSTTSGSLYLTSLFGLQQTNQPITVNVAVVLSGNQMTITAPVTTTQTITIYPSDPSTDIVLVANSGNLAGIGTGAEEGLILTQAELNELLSGQTIYIGNNNLLNTLYVGDGTSTTVHLPGPTTVLSGTEVNFLSPTTVNNLIVDGDGSDDDDQRPHHFGHGCRHQRRSRRRGEPDGDGPGRRNHDRTAGGHGGRIADAARSRDRQPDPRRDPGRLRPGRRRIRGAPAEPHGRHDRWKRDFWSRGYDLRTSPSPRARP